MANFSIETTTSDVIESFGDNAKGKTYVITGPSINGLGAEAAYALASAKPKRLILAGRSKSKIEPIIKKVSEIDSTIVVTYVRLDLAEFSSVRKAAGEITNATPDGIDGLLNNAGIMAPKAYSQTIDGNEMQFQVNHLGHFLLTKLLFPEIVKVQGVVVNITSRGFMLSDPEWDNVDFDGGKSYTGWLGYGRSKLANVHFSVALAKRAEELSVVSYSVHPGLVLDTQLAQNSNIDQDWFGEGLKLAMERSDGKPFEQVPVSLQQGAATAVWALLDTGLRASSGKHLEFGHVEDNIDEYAKSPKDAERLWSVSEKLIDEKFDI